MSDIGTVAGTCDGSLEDGGPVGHIVVCWPRGPSFHTLDRLMTLGEHEVVVVSSGASSWPEDCRSAMPDSRIRIVDGSPSSTAVLRRAWIRQASSVLVECPEGVSCAGAGDAHHLSAADSICLKTLLAARSLNDSAAICVTVSHLVHAHIFGTAGATVIVGSDVTGSRLLAQAVLQGGVSVVHEAIAESSMASCEPYPLPVPNGLVGRSFAEAMDALADRGTTLMAVRQEGGLEVNPNHAVVLREGDVLVVLAADPGHAQRVMGNLDDA